MAAGIPIRGAAPGLPDGTGVDDGGATGKTGALAKLISARLRDSQPARILVVGCGNGFDAGVVARHFGCATTAIDVENRFDRQAGAPADFLVMDAQKLQFADRTFDLIYSFHALEHMPQPVLALAEMSRVLCDGGFYCIGTPNRHRALGYIGSNVSLATKVRWNAIDWQARLVGKFRNEDGAHAGFSASELYGLCLAAFGDAADISDDYYFAIYPRHAALLRLLIAARLKRLAWPSVYILGRKRPDRPM